jgi:hypothetical protein
MKEAPFIVVAVAAAISLAAQPKPDATFVDVDIVVGSLEAHQGTCKGGKVNASTVFVVSPEQVYHCVGSQLFLHSAHGKEPAMGTTIVRVNAGQRVRWSCKTNQFVVLDVTRHSSSAPGAKPNPAAPERPFATFPKAPSNTVLSSELKRIDGKTEEHYKATFYIEGVGVVDPDLVCSM